MIGPVCLAVAVSAFLTSLTDWFFFGVWMHERYRIHEEVWRRPRGGPGQSRAVAWSALLYGVTNVAIVTLCSALGLTELGDALLAAALAWAAIPIPMLASNTLFLKLDPLLLVPHGLGWLVRLLLTAAVAAWFL
jgi:hypothetical protein